MRFSRFMSSAAAGEVRTKAAARTWVRSRVDRPVAGFARSRVGRFANDFLTFERLLAALLILFPIFLIVFNGWPGSGKDSISAYHEMTNPNNLVAFYFPLTAAAMLFVVNGFVKRRERDPWYLYYNVYLGAMLTGVVLFNNADFPILHDIFAGLFFVGNVLVIYFIDTSFFSSRHAEAAFDLALLGVMAVSFLLFLPFHVINLFFLEWISLALISVHFVLLSIGTERRRAIAEPVNS